MTQEEKAKVCDGNYKTYTELINKLEGVKDAIKKQNYGIAMDILCKPYPQFQVITHSELKESEDEKVRKDLINYFNGAALEHREEEVLAWLEKQDEQKPVDSTLEIKPKFKVGDTIKELETGNLFYVNSVEDFGYTLHYKNCNANGCTMSFKYEDKYELIEQKPAWSEEDETHRHWILEMLKAGEIKTPEFADHFKAAFNWLKSLRPQNTWKPSEEQMDAINDAIDYLGGNTKIVRKHLMSLYDDLKKLMEE